MSGDWIKMAANLGTNPKVVRIASALKADGCPDRLRVVGALHAVWCLFDAHSIDGSLSGYNLDAIDDLIGWPGFATALEAVGWIEVDRDAGVLLPRYETHNGASAKRRAMEADRKRESRNRPPPVRIDVPIVSASDADEKRTREEKKREEKKTIRAEATRGTRLPSDWTLPEAWSEWAITERPDLDPPTVAAKFADHWHAKPGSAGVKLDWLATWRNWIRAERPPQVNGNHAPQFDDWFKSDAGIERKARELGMQARSTETYSSLRERIFQRIKEPAHAS